MAALRLEDPAGLDFIIPYFLLGLACDTPVIESLCHSLPITRLTGYIQRSLFKNHILPLIDNRFHVGQIIALEFSHQYLIVSCPGILDEYYWTRPEKRKLVFHRYWRPTAFVSQTDEYNSAGQWLSEMEACLTTRGVLNLFCDELRTKFRINTNNFNPLHQPPTVLVSNNPSLRLTLHRLGKTLDFEFDFQSTTGSLLKFHFEVVKIGPVWTVKITEDHCEAPIFDCVPLETWIKGLPELFAKIPFNRDDSPKQSRRKIRSG